MGISEIVKKVVYDHQHRIYLSPEWFFSNYLHASTGVQGLEHEVGEIGYERLKYPKASEAVEAALEAHLEGQSMAKSSGRLVETVVATDVRIEHALEYGQNDNKKDANLKQLH